MRICLFQIHGMQSFDIISLFWEKKIGLPKEPTLHVHKVHKSMAAPFGLKHQNPKCSAQTNVELFLTSVIKLIINCQIQKICPIQTLWRIMKI